jgi:hypothetical protein
VANRGRFAPGTPAANEAPAVISTVTNLNALTASQASLENRYRELSRLKLEARADLREEVEFLYHTAHAAAAEIPGFDEKFQAPLLGDPKLLNASRAAVKDAAPLSAVFIQHAMPSDFLEALNLKIRNFELASEEYANGRTACSVGGKALKESLRKALAAASGFDAIMRNTFRDDPITLDAWKAACRVPRVSRQKKVDPPSTAGPQPQPEPQPQAQPPAA